MSKACGDPGTEIRTVPAAALLPLRQRLLRPGMPPRACVLPGDDEPQTRHFAAYLADRVVGIASLYHNPCPQRPDPGDWQLRSMATVEELRHRSLARRLLQACLEHARSHGGRRLWCNARVAAAGFYLRHGFDCHGREFLIPEIGPHLLMSREI